MVEMQAKDALDRKGAELLRLNEKEPAIFGKPLVNRKSRGEPVHG